LALAAGVLATLAAGARTLAARRAAQAYVALEEGDPVLASSSASAALGWHPYDLRAQYSQLVALKQLGAWDHLESSARRARAWHPDATPILHLLGEAAWRRGEAGEAASALWDALWRTPTPPRTPAQIWRVAMLAGQKSWGGADPRVAAAAVRMMTVLDRDVSMTTTTAPGAQIRKQAVGEAAAALKAAGAPLTAEEVSRTR
jgi:hypothetical protein